jgi:hypothetical protein
MDDQQKLKAVIEALRIIAYPRRGTAEETMNVEQLGTLAAEALTQIGYERD